MTTQNVDRAIERIARLQHGAFNSRQAQRAGASARMRRRRVARGTWLDLGDSVYALPSHPGTWFRQCMAATLAIVSALLSHTSAAALHQLKGFRRGNLHVVVPRDRAHKSRLATVHRQDWPKGTKAQGIPVVSLPDTFFQLATTAQPARLRRAFADAIVENEWLLPAVLDRYVDLAPLPGWEHGEARVDTLVPDWGLIIEAYGRRWLAVHLAPADS